MSTDGHDHEPHDGGPHSEHEHGHAHSHATLDRELVTHRAAVRALAVSIAGLGATAAAQLVIHAFSGSVSLFADALHNLGDVAGTAALWVGFHLSRRSTSDRFTYGWRRAEDLAGLVIVLAIAVSAGLAAWDAVRALVGGGHEVGHVGWAFAAAVVGAVGNEGVALYKTRVGRRIGSVALEADGQHARVDGLVSLAAAGGIAGAWLGYPLADALVGLGIALVIVRILWGTGREVLARNLDAVQAGLVDAIRATAEEVEGVRGVHDVRARYVGHSLLVQLHLELDGRLTLAEAHALGEQARHALFHAFEELVELDVHLDPAGDPAAHHDLTAHHTAEEPSS